MLTAEQSLPYWQVTELAENEYNVADAPMEGEMDSTFFLTKDQNYIPHTYPCRTQYITEARDKEPVPFFAPDWSKARNILPNGSNFLDLSGFWFRATRLGGWARTALKASAAGRARLRLGICGAARLVVNGTDAGWLAPTRRNAMDQAEFDVELILGHNEIAVWFEDLAERDAVIRIQITWISGPEAEAAYPYEAEAGLVSAVEAAIGAMYLNRQHYDDEEIQLKLPVAFPAQFEGTVTVKGHFMAHGDATFPISAPADANTVRLCHSSALLSDYRYFHFDLNCRGFQTQAVLGAEISCASSLPPAPGQVKDRASEALLWIAENAETDTGKALACLAVGRAQDLAEAERIFEAMLPPIERCFDCADFALVPLIWARMAYADRLPEALRERMDRAMLDYRYWFDEPGNDVQWYFSENHALLFHTACYFAGLHLQDKTFSRLGRSGAAQHAVGRDRLRKWFDHFEMAELAEFNSAPYFPIDLKGLTMLYALAPDADIAARAGRAIMRLVTLIANSAHHGVMTGAQGRSYQHSLCATDTVELTAIARLAWGGGSYGAHVNCLPQLALAIRDHGLELPDLHDRVSWSADNAQEWTYQQGENAFCSLYHYKTADIALGSAVRYRWGDWGYQETLIHARLGKNPRAQLWINHPGEPVQCGFGRPSYWGGSASVPRVQQYRGLAIVIFNGVPPQIDFTHAWFPVEAFDEWSVKGNRAMARAGQGAILLSGKREISLQTTGASANAELRQSGRDGVWVLRTGSASSGADFAQCHKLDLKIDADGICHLTDAEYGPVIFYTDGRVEAEGRILAPQDWTLEGQYKELPLTKS